MRIEITIPGKIDCNHRPRATIRGGRVRTYKAAGYREYLCRVRLCTGARLGHLGLVRSWPLDARYSVAITVHEPDRRSRDLDNTAKPIADGMTGYLWADDRQIDDLRIVRGEVRKSAPCVVVTVAVLPPSTA